MTSHILRRCTKHGLLVLLAFLSAAPALAQQGAITVSRNLEQMVEGASDIVRARVLSVRVEKHPELRNLDTVVVSLQVIETLKGGAHGTVHFRQYVWDLRDRQETAGYGKGQEYILLLNPPSRLGLTSPAGLEQGRFRVLRGADGRQFAVNGRDNAFLMRGVGARAARNGAPLTASAADLVSKHQKGPIPADDLSRLIRELVQADGQAHAPPAG